MSQWHLIGVLPNLPIDHSWDFEHLSFAHPSDKRLEDVRAKSAAARSLLTNFKHPFGRGCRPSAFIVSNDCPKRLRSAEALADLRNAFAVASALYGWQNAIGNPNIWFPQYSDYFDLYPIFPSNDGVGLICNGFALNSYDSADEFHGQPHPDLSAGRSSFKVSVDQRLLDLLIGEWKRKYATAKPSWKQTAVFRSLAIAYRAVRLPKGCDHIVFDIGVQLSLWVSAHECLTHPGPGGWAGLNEVLALLGKKQWLRSELSVRRRQVVRRGRRKGLPTDPMTYVQHLYRRLYDARNDFLHGNPVGVKTVFVGPATRDALSIQVAPLIYSAALDAALTVRVARKKRDLQEIVRAAFRSTQLETALLKTREQRKRR
jgi:hypothetical protein